MITGLIGLISAALALWLFYARKSAKKKTPREKYDADIQEFNKNLSNGDALGVSAQFEQLRREAKKRGHNPS